MVTIHQPSIEIFEGFDALFLLQRGGRVSPCSNLSHHCLNHLAVLMLSSCCSVVAG